MQMHVWDPRKGENYTLEDFETKQTFSSMDEGVFVVEAISVDWNEPSCKYFLHGLLHDTQTNNLTIIITPWIKEKYFKENLDELVDVDYSLPNYIAQFETNEELLDGILEVRGKLGYDKSGEWIIIGSNKKLRLDEGSIAGGFSKILDQANNFEFLIYMAEMQQYYFIFKPFDRVDLLLKKIY
ncbi:hypothetical protein [Thiolapillus sp.]